MKKTVFITGANGEIGQGLIHHLAEEGDVRIVALDLHPIEPGIAKKCHSASTGDILSTRVLADLSSTYSFDTIYHLAALLSTKSENQPRLAHDVNVDGTLNLLEMAVDQCRRSGGSIRFMYPSSIAVYGLPDTGAKKGSGKVREDDHCSPRTMYGINKLYCEQLGRYYARYYRQLDAESRSGMVDFRALRFPGLISAATLPTGGTSDYVPEMLHHAAQGRPYACFVREDTTIPFMAMPDAIRAILRLEAAPPGKLSRLVYNVSAFNPSALEFSEKILPAFPGAKISFNPDARRQAIVDSWPAAVDTSAAVADWGWEPEYSLGKALSDYLIPATRKRYGDVRGKN